MAHIFRLNKINTNKKYRKYLIAVIIVAILFLHWYYGTLIFSRFLYPGLDKKSFANATVKNWLVMMDKNQKDYLKLYWPTDTIKFYGNLQIDTIVYKNYVAIQENNVYKLSELAKEMTESNIRVYESSPRNDYNYPMVFTVNIQHQDMDSLKMDTAIVGLQRKKETVFHRALWSISYVGRRYRWYIYQFEGKWNLSNLKIDDRLKLKENQVGNSR